MTFKTRYGIYKYKVLPFGLMNGPATFQAYINLVLGDLLDVTCIAYIDNILIFSEDPSQYEAYVKAVLDWLAKAGL